ncbi:excisionase family DNA-binding protein [Paraburkholderia sp. A3BS-1L]|uniref:excisionase family DNA-binding protein n=1 Tax=Paraburkholderia sp. A3BS-1L TaxID=3028375 RepID=UPI003DA9AAE8
MTIAELAKRLNVTRRYVRELIDSGKLPAKPGPDGEPVVDRDVAEEYIAEAKRRRDKAMDEYMLVSSEQHAAEQLNQHFDAFMHVARRATAEEVVRVRCAYEVAYAVCRFAVNMDGIRISTMDNPDAFARAVVERASRVLQLSPEEARQAQVLNDWGLAGVPAEPPLTAEAAVRLADRMLAASFASRGRG